MCRSQRSSLWLLDSAGLISEEIFLNPSDYCPYSATGSATVSKRELDNMPNVTPAGLYLSLFLSTGGCGLCQLWSSAGF